MSRLTLTTLLLLWTLLLRAVFARECGNETGFIRDITVWSQQDADTKLDGCTSLVCALIIGHNYAGDFVLRGVTNLTKGFSTFTGYSRTTPDEIVEGVPGLTSVTAPDVLEVGSYSLDLEHSTALKSVSFEKLRKAYNLNVELGTVDSSLSFPSLESVVGRLTILGNFSSMNFESLTSVGSTITVRNRRDGADNIYLYMYSVDIRETAALDIEFPSLVNCSTLKFWGNISRVSMPKLETIADFTGDDMFYDYGHDLSVYTQGLPLNLSLPSLWNISDVGLSGTFGSISLPALKHVEKYTIISGLPMDVNLAPLESAATISFYGNVTDYNITSLTNISEYLHINSELSPSCGPGKEKWLELHPQYSKTYIPGFYCDEEPKKHFPGKKLGLGLGIGVPLLIIFAAVIWQCRRNSKKKEAARKDPLPDYETEMEARRTGGGEVLPEYTPPRDESSADVSSSVSSLSDMARPAERPPGYEAANIQERHATQVQGSRDPLV